jgi:hypothetical protein
MPFDGSVTIPTACSRLIATVLALPLGVRVALSPPLPNNGLQPPAADAILSRRG